MNYTTDETYLATEVLTAPPQKRHLMLVAAALRHARAAHHALGQQRQQQAAESLIRAQEIVGELLAGLRTERAPELTRKVAGIYLFIYRSLVTAHLRQSDADLQSAIAVLQEELATWQAVCAQLPADSSADVAHSGATDTATTPSAVADPPQASWPTPRPHEQASSLSPHEATRRSVPGPMSPLGPYVPAPADSAASRRGEAPHEADSAGLNFQA
jgi:flagellar protein FliS